MLKFIIRRVLLMIPVLLGVTLVTFIIVRSIPGDPVQVLLGLTAGLRPSRSRRFVKPTASISRCRFSISSGLATS